MVERDRDDAAEREATDVRVLDAEFAHGREDRRRIIVAARAVGRRIAVAIAGIVERDSAPAAAEMLELRPPHRFVRSDAVEEDDRDRAAAPGLVIAERDSEGGCDAGHG